MKVLLTVDRVKAILAGVMTETDAALALRRHRIRYTFSTAGGILHIRVPARSGCITITRTASRTNPFRVEAAGNPGTVPYPFPVPRWTWDD